MTIARIDNFALRHKTYLGEHTYSTHDIEIVKYQSETCYTIASFNEDGEITSCCDRLLESMGCVDDLDAIKTLSRIAYMIITETDCCESGINGKNNN